MAKTGMNAFGIGLATNALVTDADAGESGAPYHVLLRAILDAQNVTDAYRVLLNHRRSSSANYLVAHADGIAMDIEAAPGDFGRLFVWTAEHGLILHTNHFRSPNLPVGDVSIWAMPDTQIRLARLNDLTAPTDTPLDVDEFQRILADHANFPDGVCCHVDARRAPLDRSATVGSVIMDLDERALWLASGTPCVAPYERLDYADFLRAPAGIRQTATVS
ncbi:MAG: C45 family peptidase [Acidimicrobiia bacterium]|nr:C45 family peptidase [Acidimicrobiia bacterium]